MRDFLAPHRPRVLPVLPGRLCLATLSLSLSTLPTTYQYPTASTIPVCAPTSGDPQSLAVDMGIFRLPPQAPTLGAPDSFAIGGNVSSQLVPETL
jgi:hypothetical protein